MHRDRPKLGFCSICQPCGLPAAKCLVYRRAVEAGGAIDRTLFATGTDMSTEVATAIAYVGAFVGLVGGGVALFNSWKAVNWKRAELANTYLKDFYNNAELVFASRCLDWNGGKLVLPDNLRPYLKDDGKLIQHDREIFAMSLRPDLLVIELDKDPRIQIYRTAINSFYLGCALLPARSNAVFSKLKISKKSAIG